MKLTDEEVVRVLAEREGKAWTRNGANEYGLPDYLTSRDALAPVLEKLTGDERIVLGRRIWDLWESFTSETGNTGNIFEFEIFILTLPPRDLAHAIAEAITTTHEQPAQ